MWEELKPIYPAGPCNRTDPQMLHKSKYEAEPIVTQYRAGYDASTNAANGQVDDATRYDAISYPLIRVNNHNIGEEQIVKFILHNNRFTPWLDLVFEDTYGTIEFSDMPGLNNVITVVILEGIPDAHKPIKLNFYITSCEIINSTFYIQAEFKHLSLEAEQFKQEVFYWPSPGCSYCGLGPDFTPTTFEFLHVVADNCGLGFGATQHTKEVNDVRYRLLKKEKYKDAIQDAVACGGINEDNMFDAWVDLYGNIIMANVSWVLSEAVMPDELATVTTAGVDTQDAQGQGTKVNVGWTHRILSNVSQIAGFNNMMVSDVKKLVDLHSGFYGGTLTDYYTVYPSGAKTPDGKDASNSVEMQQIQETEASIGASGDYAGEYEFQSFKDSGFDMAELTHTVAQKQRHDAFFKKLRSKMYKVTMNEPNFGLERGMLTYLEWFLSSPTQKGTALKSRENLHEDTSGEPEKVHVTEEDEAAIDEYSLVLDTALSGIYYIDATDFEYNPDNGKIQQHLYLIKRNALTEYYNKATAPRLKDRYGEAG